MYGNNISHREQSVRSETPATAKCSANRFQTGLYPPTRLGVPRTASPADTE